MSILTMIYWGRLLLGLAVAGLCAAFNVGLLGITFAVSIYLASYLVLRLHLGDSPNIPGGPRKLVTEGIGTYFLVWLTAWTLLYTLIGA